MSRIAILGAGAWGTALAISLARRGGHELCLWSHSAALAEQLADAGENLHYLPGFTLPVDIQVTSDLPRAIFESDILLCVTPSQHRRGVITDIAPLLTRHQIILSATKAIEETTFLRMSQVVAAVANNPFAVLSGPSFAQEVAAGMPTAVVAASRHPPVAQIIQRDFTSPNLRVYSNDDVTVVELGGAMNNVIALAAVTANVLIF